MKFIINEPEDKEPKIKLKLEAGKNKIHLVGINKAGDKFYIMEFENGKFFRAANVELEGLETDEAGKIIEEK